MKRYIFLLVLLIGFISPTVFAQTTTNFGYGVTNVSNADPLGYITLPVPVDMIQVFDDFNTDASIVGAASVNVATPETAILPYSQWYMYSVGSYSNGITASTLVINTGPTDNDNVFYRSRDAIFLPATGKEIYFEALINFASTTGDTTQSDMLTGLLIVDNTPIDTTSGIWFQKRDGSDNFQFRVANSGNITEATPNITIAVDTNYKLSYHYDGVSKINYFINDVQYGAAATTYLPTTALVATFGVQTGTSSAAELDIDYIYAAMER